MALTEEDYLHQLQALLPQGPAWPRDSTTTLGKLLASWGVELARIDGRAEQLLDEADPRTTSEMLSDWERVAGLPDLCTGTLSSITERRAALLAKLTNIGGQSRQFYINLAAALGYEITITEFDPFSVESDVDYLLYDDDWQFAWQVNASQDTVREFDLQSVVDDALATWGNALLECAISRLKPAHTVVIFAYS